MDQPLKQNEATQTVRYELAITAEEARTGTRKLLSRNNKRLEVKVAAGATTGSSIKLTNALQLTDGSPGDIIIHIKIKDEETPSAGILELDEGNFDSEVLNSSLPVLVDFWAAWCTPCRVVAPIIGDLSTQFSGRFKFCKVNVDENPALSERYQVMSIPMLLFFKNGQVVDKIVGAAPEPQVRARIEALL